MPLSKEEEYRRMSQRYYWNWDTWKVWDYLRIRKKVFQEMIAECLGVFILVTLGNGAVAQSVLSGETKGQFLSVNLAYGVGVTMAVLAVGNISGAHINPAVSIAFAITGKLPIYKLPLYILAQVIGGFLSGAIVYSVYFDAIHAFSPGGLMVNETAGIFATYPQSFLSVGNGFWDQVFATAFLLFMILAITDENNSNIPDGVKALLLGFVVLVIGLSFGYNCGYAINPARDFGPRLFTLCVYGGGVFTEGDNWWWVPILGPIVGGVTGLVFYKVLIGIQIEARKNSVRSASKYNEQVNFSNMEINENSPNQLPETPTTPTRL